MKFSEMPTKGAPMDGRGLILVFVSIVLFLLILLAKGWHPDLWWAVGGWIAGSAHIFYCAHLSIEEDKRREKANG